MEWDRVLQVELDSEAVVKVILKQFDSNGNPWDLLEIGRSSSPFVASLIKISRTLSGGNKCADLLANLGLEGIGAL